MKYTATAIIALYVLLPAMGGGVSNVAAANMPTTPNCLTLQSFTGCITAVNVIDATHATLIGTLEQSTSQTIRLNDLTVNAYAANGQLLLTAIVNGPLTLQPNQPVPAAATVTATMSWATAYANGYLAPSDVITFVFIPNACILIVQFNILFWPVSICYPYGQTFTVQYTIAQLDSLLFQ